MRLLLIALAFTAAAFGCESERSAAPKPAPEVARARVPNAALAPNPGVAAGPGAEPSLDMVNVELDMDEEDGLGGHEARGRSEADPSGEPMDEMDEGSDISGAPEKAGASDDPAVVHEQPARR